MPAVFTDDFNRADSSTLGANWTTTPSGTSWQIASNKATCPGNDAVGYQSILASWSGGDDQYSQIKVISHAGGGVPNHLDYGPMVRAATGAETFYLADFNSTDDQPLGSSAFQLQFLKKVAGTFTQLGSTVTGLTINSGDTIYLEVQGDTLKAKINATVVGTVAGGGAISTGRPGIFAFVATNAGNGATWDDYEAGNFVTFVPRQTYMALVLTQ